MPKAAQDPRRVTKSRNGNNGEEVYIAWWSNGTGKDRVVIRGTGSTDKEAIRRREDNIRRRIASGQGIEKKTRSNMPMLSDYLEVWLGSYGPEALGGETRRKYRRDLELHVIPHIDKRLDHISRDELRTLFHTTLVTDKKPSARVNAYKTLRTLLNYAVNENVLIKSPLTGVTEPKRIIAVQRADEELITKRVNIAKDMLYRLSSPEHPLHDHYPRIMLSFLGLRRAELLGLTWENVRQLNKPGKANIVVCQSLKRAEDGSGWYLHNTTGRGDGAGTKNGDRRTIYLPEGFRNALIKEKKKNRTATEDKFKDLVFLRKDGRHIDFNTNDKAWNDAMYEHINHKRKTPQPITKSERWRFHANRHIAAVMMFENNIPLEVVQKVLGHNDRAMTLYYAKISQKSQKEAMSIYDEAWNWNN